ncbi:MAG TPA: M28 family peptidase [Cytophagaceae bacterium]|jgi:aminopeptidase YwaD|nr:M28 family peptidase [Cytophagaceae bacterium]
MKPFPFFWLVLIAFMPSLQAQDMEKVHRYLDTLCSNGLHGRGASFDGQKKAALYLSDRFREIGLTPLPSSDSYFQKFHYDINTFPGKLSLRTAQSVLIPGIDFIVEPGSPSDNKKLKIMVLDSLLFCSEKRQKKFLSTNLRKKALIYDETFAKLLKTTSDQFFLKTKEAACIVELKEKKLTMGLASSQNAKPSFQVLKQKFDATTKTLSYEIEAALLKNYEAENVIGFVKGTSVPDSFIFITAHYDHLGNLGAAQYFPGANDNGSGISMLLELARFFKENPSRYSIIFIAFGAEEAGLIGSNYFTENPLVALSKIRFLINLDLMGTGDEGMMVVNGSVFSAEFELLNNINTKTMSVSPLKKRGKAANSDHFYFSEKGVPSFFFYTLGGITAYHDVHDIPQTLPLTKFREVFGLIKEFMKELTD